MPSRVWACNLDQLSALSVSWVKYPIENNSNHVLESGLTLWMSSNGVVSFRPNWSGTWFRIIDAWRNAKYQNSHPTCFFVTNALTIWIKACHVCYADTFEDWRPPGAAIVLKPFESIHRRAFTPINFLSESE